MDNHSSQIPAELVQLLRAAQRVTVLTGAGISAESGVPTFRAARPGQPVPGVPTRALHQIGRLHRVVNLTEKAL